MLAHGRITQLPQVSTQTWLQVVSEWNSEAKAANFVASTYDRLQVDNPEIAESLSRVFLIYKGEAGFPLKSAMVYACSVYRMLEVEVQTRLPVVSTETLAPIEEDLIRDRDGFYLRLVQQVQKENPNVLESVVLLNVWYARAGDLKAAALIPQVGLMIYKMLASQIEANNLTERFGL